MKSDVEISVFLAPTWIHPKSRGTIRLKSTDPFEHPSIDPRYLEEKKDVEVFTEGMY
jgi:choline dehydrogenase-like flavoprotein